MYCSTRSTSSCQKQGSRIELAWPEKDAVEDKETAGLVGQRERQGEEANDSSPRQGRGCTIGEPGGNAVHGWMKIKGER